MRHLSPRSLLLAAVLFVVPAFGQNGVPPLGTPNDRQAANDERSMLLKELGLTDDQVQHIRRTNRARRPYMEEAGKRLRDANRALDSAIYADKLNEEDVAAKLQELQRAQAEVAKLRFRGELELRKVLTPEQLTKFRELRERFGRRREVRRDRRRNRPPGQRPLDRLRQLPRRGNQD